MVSCCRFHPLKSSQRPLWLSLSRCIRSSKEAPTSSKTTPGCAMEEEMALNCTGDMPHPDCEEPFSNFAKARIILYIISFLLSLIGNGCVVLVTLKKLFTKANINAFKLLIGHLALVDFLFSCNIFVLIPNELYNVESEDPLPMCTFKRLLRQFPLMVSIGNVVLIAIERYKSISSNFTVRKWSTKRLSISILIVWVVAFVVYIPETSSLRPYEDGIGCQRNLSLPMVRLNAVFLILMEYVLPLCIIGFCNYKVINVIRSRNTINLLSDDMQARDREQKKSMKILVAIVLGFAILALPNQIFFAYLDLGNNFNEFSKAWDILQMCAIILLFHASFNAGLYSIVDAEFRRDVKELCCFCCLGATTKDHLSTSTTASAMNSKGYDTSAV